MRFALTGARDDVAAALALAARFTAAHSSTEALNHIRIRANRADGTSTAEATDQRMSVRTHLWATPDEDEVEVLAHTGIVRAVQAMPPGDVTLAHDREKDGNVIVVSGKGRSRYTVELGSGSPVTAFPGEEEIDWGKIAAVDAGEAIGVMQQAARFVSAKENNPSLTGVSLRVIDKDLSIDATDGFRLFHDSVPLPAEGFPFDEDEVLVPARMVAELARTFPSGKLRLAATRNMLFARDDAGETLFAARRIGGKFPELSQIVPEYDQLAVRMPREDLASALRRIRGVVRGKPVQLSIANGSCRLHARDAGASAEEYVDLPGAGNDDAMEIAFNVDSLDEGIGLFGADEVTIDMLTAMRPARISDGGQRFFLLATTKAK